MNTPDWTSIDAYLAGDGTAEQRAEVSQWLAEDPSHEAALEALRKGAPIAEHSYDVSAAWVRFQAMSASPRVDVTPVRRAPAWQSGALRIAAAVVMCAGAAMLWQRTRVIPPAQTENAPRFASYITGAGERREIDLGNGSHATLNAGSTLRVDASVASREVWLDGEAYFDVRHDAAKPFRVHTDNGVGEDIGTRFVVRAYRELARTEIAVAEGSVRLGRTVNDTSGRTLTAGMLGVLRAVGALTVTTLTTSERYFGWTKGILALDGGTLREAVPLLERWYGVKIRLADSTLGEKHVFARFEHETITQAIEALALTLDATSHRDGTTITLSPRGR